MKDPNIQSTNETPHTPHAMLIPDQGTTPTRRRIESRTQAGDFELVLISDSGSDSNALRARASGRGKKRVRIGARGVARRDANIEPMVVTSVRRSVAHNGERRAPARTFYVKLRKRDDVSVRSRMFSIVCPLHIAAPL